MSEVVVAFVWGDGLQDCSDAIPKGWDRALTSLAQVGFEFCEGLLDGIEIGGIGRQVDGWMLLLVALALAGAFIFVAVS